MNWMILLILPWKLIWTDWLLPTQLLSRSNLISTPNEIRKAGAGGLSGKPLTNESTRITNYIFEKTNGTIPLISSGGIFTGEDAKEKFNAGAVLDTGMDRFYL